MNNNLHILCPNCGMEVNAPDAADIANSLGKMPTEGTYYLIPKEIVKNGKRYNVSNVLNNISNMLYDTDIIEKKADETAGKYTDENEIDAIKNKIKKEGDIKSNHLYRRWIYAMTIRSLPNYDARYISGTPYKYEWKSLLTELKILAAMERDNDPELTNRERFFNKDIIAEMLLNYKDQLNKYLHNSYMPNKRRPCIRKTKTILHATGEYEIINIPYYNVINLAEHMDMDTKKIHHEIIFIGDYDYAYNKIKKDATFVNVSDNKMCYTAHGIFVAINRYVLDIVENIRYNNISYEMLYKKISKLIKIAPMRFKMKKDEAWKNAFKGIGAYYTMQNLIRFHGHGIKTDRRNPNSEMVYGEKGIEILDQYASLYNEEYYRLFAMMKDMILYNNKDELKETIQELNTSYR